MPSGFATLPAGDVLLRRARVPAALIAAPGLAVEGPWVDCDLMIAGGRIAAVTPLGALTDGPPPVDLDHGIVLPRLVDIHTHIDKGHIVPRHANPDGTHGGARESVAADRTAHWSAEDVRRRMDFSLRCAYAHGTGALRTHIDSIGPQTAISWPVFAEMRAAWQDRIALQAVSIFAVDMAIDDEPQFRALVDTVARHEGLLGGLTFLGEPPGAKLAAALDRIFAAAQAHGLDLDFHVDESHSPDARSLGAIAEAALRHRFRGTIVAGHCCSLALCPDSERDEIIAKVRDAGIAVVALPMCNMYLQDRQGGRTPRWRGVAPLHELHAAGVRVMVASDNTRDPFYAYGDLDPIEVFREATRILHFDHCDTPWITTVGTTPADVMRLPAHGRIAEGGRADLVLTRARSFDELLARPQSDRVVLVGGKQIDTRLPDYRELDDLMFGTTEHRSP
jgi:cytosine/creatinine deaminase